MSHVTDGQLHAYLDGALDRIGLGGAGAADVRSHLETCAECKARLSEERDIRDRSKEILAESGPASLNMPPFEEIRQRAMAPAPSPANTRSGPPRGWGLAWAASVVLALGLGWVGRDLGWRGADLSTSETTAELFERPPAASAPAASAPAAVLEADRATDLDALEGPQAELGAGQRARRLRSDVSSGEAPARQSEALADAVAPVPEVTTGSAAANAVGAAVGRVNRNEDLQQKAASADQRLPEEVAPEAPASAVEGAAEQRRAAEQSATEAEEAQVGNRPADAPILLQETTVMPNPPGLESDSKAVLAVPGLEVRSITVEAGDIVVVQELPEGGVLELRYTEVQPVGGDENLDAVAGFRDRAAAEPADDEARRELQKPDLQSSVVRPHGNGWLVASAPLAAEDLERLLDRIR